MLAFASGESLDQFAREQGVDPGELDELLRTALLRAVDDAEQAGALNPTVAGIVRQLVMRVELDQVLELLERLPGLLTWPLRTLHHLSRVM